MKSKDHFINQVRRLNSSFLHDSPFPRGLPKMSRVIESIRSKYPDETDSIPSSQDLTIIRSLLQEHFSKHGNLDFAELRLLKRSPFALFIPNNESQAWLFADTNFASSYLSNLERRKISAAVVGLAVAMLLHYPESHPAFPAWRLGILRALSQLKTSKTEQWIQRIDQFGLLDKDAPHRLAVRLLDSNNLYQVLGLAGLTGILTDSRLLNLTIVSLLNEIKLRLETVKLSARDLERCLDFFVNDNQEKLRYPALRNEFAEALLLPYVNKQPPELIRKSITKVLLGAYGHPLIKRGNWGHINQLAQNVFVCWLTVGAIVDFFRIIEKTAYDAHWRFRQKFWKSVLDDGFIEHAWLVVGDYTKNSAREYLSNISSYSMYKNYSGILFDHSTLIMQLTDGSVVTEWSHNGKCRIWLPNNRNQPQMKEQPYDRDDLVYNPDFEQTHHGSNNGTWQGQVAHWLRLNTGIYVRS